jgi:membrane protein implicated in regulation of membrane protease activity
LLGLKFMGFVAPPASAGILLRMRGIVIVVLLVVGLLALGLGIVELVSLPFGGLSLDLAIFYGFVLVAVAIGVLAYFGRRRQRKAQAERAEQTASRAR